MVRIRQSVCFTNKTEEEREEYVSRLKMKYFCVRYSPRNLIPLFGRKQVFLKSFSKFIHRKWLFVPNASFEEFSQLLYSCDCIVKPTEESLGRGIFKVYKDDEQKDVKKLYETRLKGKMIVEECIESCEELKAFHPQSLNTIRVVTISNRKQKKSEVIGSFIRTGVGNSIVDNAHAGGVFALINLTDGEVETDGADTKGNKYELHPDSGVRFKGFKIPKYDRIKAICCEAAKLTDNPLTGWDVAINNKGEIDFVEANCWPDFDVMQTPQKGIKKRIDSLLKEYYSIEL